MMKIFSKETLKPFDWFLILGIITINIVYAVLANELDAIGIIASITGVICVVLVAKRSIANYLFGLINVSLYAYISYKSEIYGDFLLNALYYLPMQFVGWYLWIKDRGDLNSKGVVDDTLVKSKMMSWMQRGMLCAFCILTTLIGGFLLSKYTSDPQPYKDSATTILSVVAMFLMVKKFTEQWALWATVNTISILMWMFVWIDGGSHAGLMVCMWIFYLANSINGLIVWSKAAEDEDIRIQI